MANCGAYSDPRAYVSGLQKTMVKQSKVCFLFHLLLRLPSSITELCNSLIDSICCCNRPTSIAEASPPPRWEKTGVICALIKQFTGVYHSRSIEIRVIILPNAIIFACDAWNTQKIRHLCIKIARLCNPQMAPPPHPNENPCDATDLLSKSISSNVSSDAMQLI